MTDIDLLTSIDLRLELLNNQLLSVQQGLKVVITVLIFFLAWQVIRILWKLFNGWFFGGI